MKALIYSVFALAMLVLALTNPHLAALALIATFVVGALLTPALPGVLCSNVSGYLGSANADANDAVGEWQQYVLHRNGKGMNTGSTLFGLMSRLANEEADAQVFNWWEKDPVRRTFYSDASSTDSDTTLTFDDNATSPATDIWVFLAAGAILLNDRTGERIRVATTPTTSTVTVTRGVQGTTAAAINDNDVWTLVTLAKVNGTVPRPSAYAQPTSYTNYIQTFNSTASIDNAYKAGILRTDIEGPQMESQLEALEQIANDIEWAYFLGVKELATVNDGTRNGPAYYTGGIKAAIDTASLTDNALDGNESSGVTLDAFSNWLESCMTVGSDTKLFLGGPKAYSAITKFANSNSGGYRSTDHSESVWGMAIETIKTPFGELSMASHPLFKNVSVYNDWGFVIDLQLIKQKTMEPLFFQEYEPTNGQDAWQGQFRAKLGLKQKYPEAFAYCYDLQKINAA